MEQRHYHALRAWLNQSATDEFTADWREPFQRILRTYHVFDAELNRVYLRCNAYNNYWFFQRWTWWQSIFWNEEEREFYRELVANRETDLRRLPAILAGMLVAYTKERAPASYARYDMFRRGMRRHLERSLGLWFWQRWWGWGLGTVNLNTPRGLMLQFWQLSFLGLIELKAHEACFVASARASAASSQFHHEVDARLIALLTGSLAEYAPTGRAKGQQQALLDRFRRGESVHKFALRQKLIAYDNSRSAWAKVFIAQDPLALAVRSFLAELDREGVAETAEISSLAFAFFLQERSPGFMPHTDSLLNRSLEISLLHMNIVRGGAYESMLGFRSKLPHLVTKLRLKHLVQLPSYLGRPSSSSDEHNKAAFYTLLSDPSASDLLTRFDLLVSAKDSLYDICQAAKLLPVEKKQIAVEHLCRLSTHDDLTQRISNIKDLLDLAPISERFELLVWASGQEPAILKHILAIVTTLSPSEYGTALRILASSSATSRNLRDILPEKLVDYFPKNVRLKVIEHWATKDSILNYLYMIIKQFPKEHRAEAMALLAKGNWSNIDICYRLYEILSRLNLKARLELLGKINFEKNNLLHVFNIIILLPVQHSLSMIERTNADHLSNQHLYELSVLLSKLPDESRFMVTQLLLLKPTLIKKFNFLACHLYNYSLTNEQATMLIREPEAIGHLADILNNLDLLGTKMRISTVERILSHWKPATHRYYSNVVALLDCFSFTLSKIQILHITLPHIKDIENIRELVKALQAILPYDRIRDGGWPDTRLLGYVARNINHVNFLAPLLKATSVPERLARLDLVVGYINSLPKNLTILFENSHTAAAIARTFLELGTLEHDFSFEVFKLSLLCGPISFSEKLSLARQLFPEGLTAAQIVRLGSVLHSIDADFAHFMLGELYSRRYEFNKIELKIGDRVFDELTTYDPMQAAFHYGEVEPDSPYYEAAQLGLIEMARLEADYDHTIKPLTELARGTSHVAKDARNLQTFFARSYGRGVHYSGVFNSRPLFSGREMWQMAKEKVHAEAETRLVAVQSHESSKLSHFL